MALRLSADPSAAVSDTPPMSPPDSPRQQQIAHARRAWLTQPPSATDALVEGWFDRAWIERSWRRCLAQGQRPDQRVDFDPVPPGARRQSDEANHALLTAARPELERLARAVAPIRYFALLTDAHGMVIDTAGAIDRTDRRAGVIARVGVDLSERRIGTSAIGAALSELQPVWLHRGEHFFNDTSVYSCAGAPVFGATGLCAGMLDLTGIDVPERPELQHLVARSARSIENALVLAAPRRLALAIGWAEALADDADGLLCLDGDGRVVSANTAARHMLPELRAMAHAAVHASEVFAAPWQSLFDHAAHDVPYTVPLWSGLRVSVRAHQPLPAPAPPSPRDALPLRALETQLIRQAVRDAHGNVSEAARALGVSRATVYRKLGPVRTRANSAR